MVTAVPLLETRLVLYETGSTGHHPVLFRCSDGNIWFCKYVLSGYGEFQTDLLYYELIGTTLLRLLGIPTPDAAFVRITDNSCTADQIPNNANNMVPGVVAFGSKQVPLGDLVDDLLEYRTAADFRKLKNPEDLIRIALFDLWVANMDRGKDLEFIGRPGVHNFNLLMAPVKGGHQFLAIDHASILGNSLFLRDFRPDNIRTSTDNKLFTTSLFSSICHHLGATRCQAVLDEFFLTSLPSIRPNDLFATLAQAQPHWEYPPAFDARLTDFLWNAERLALVEQEARAFFNHPRP
jgi:hypothetical protein